MKKFDFAINSIFFVLSFFFFIRLFSYSNIKYALYFVPSAIVVYFLKAFRLRLLLAGEKIVLNKYIQVFCKTTIASVLLPFKIGEIFKIYSFARLTKNATKGTTIILLDRFVDTAALLCIFAVLNLFENTENFVFYLLFSIEVLLFLLYLLISGMLLYWKEYLLSADATKQHYYELKIVFALSFVYEEIQKLIKGKFFVILSISFLAWIAEISALIVSLRVFNKTIPSIFAQYLSSILTGDVVLQQKVFEIVSVVLLVIMYFVGGKRK